MINLKSVSQSVDPVTIGRDDNDIANIKGSADTDTPTIRAFYPLHIVPPNVGHVENFYATDNAYPIPYFYRMDMSHRAIRSIYGYSNNTRIENTDHCSIVRTDCEYTLGLFARPPQNAAHIPIYQVTFNYVANSIGSTLICRPPIMGDGPMSAVNSISSYTSLSPYLR